MPARPAPLMLLLLVACATGNGPDVPDATASQREPTAPGGTDCTALQREISTLPDITGMQGGRNGGHRRLAAWHQRNDITGLTNA